MRASSGRSIKARPRRRTDDSIRSTKFSPAEFWVRRPGHWARVGRSTGHSCGVAEEHRGEVIGSLPARPLQRLHLARPVAIFHGSKVLHNEPAGRSQVGHRHSGRRLVDWSIPATLSPCFKTPCGGSPSPPWSRPRASASSLIFGAAHTLPTQFRLHNYPDVVMNRSVVGGRPRCRHL